MTTQNGPRHGATQQPWWTEQQSATPTAQYPSRIPAQRTAGWPAPPAPPRPPKRSTGRRLATWFGAVVAAVVVLAVGVAIGGSGQQPTVVAAAPASDSGADRARIATLEQQLSDAQRTNQDLQTRLDSQTVAPAAPPAPAAPVETGPATTVSDGVYEVGTDMAPGRYKTDGPGSGSVMNMCYVSRNKDDSNELDSIIANDIAEGPSSVTVKDGEFAKFSGGCTWTKQ